MKKITKNKKIIIAISFLVTIIITTTLTTLYIKRLAYNEDVQNYSVTFVQPKQAVVFWSSSQESIGYLKHGTKKYSRKNSTYQTSSTPGTVHAVVIEDIPLEGIYISVHSDKDENKIPQIRKIKYDFSLEE